MKAQSFIALLRGVNVSGHNRVPMAELRVACGALGFNEVQTVIQSGNVVFVAAEKELVLEEALEGLVEERFGVKVPVLVRTSREWSLVARGNPFPEESRTEGNRVMLALSKSAPKEAAAEEMQGRTTAGERVRRVGDAIWIHFAGGSGKSKLSPLLLDRLAGSPVTMRNWRTVVKLEELARTIDKHQGGS